MSRTDILKQYLKNQAIPEEEKDFEDKAMEFGGKVLEKADPLLRVLDYPAGLLRGAVAGGIEAATGRDDLVDIKDVLKGKAPASGEILEKMGVSEGRSLSDILPGMYSESGKGAALQKGGLFDPTARGAVGMLADVVLDPLAIGGAKAASKAAKSEEPFLNILNRKAGIQQPKEIATTKRLPNEIIPDIDPNTGMYSKLEHVIKSQKASKFTPDQIRGILKSQGVKKEEIKDALVEEFLKDKKSVTKDELLDHINQNRLRVDEINLFSDPNAREISGVPRTGDRVKYAEQNPLPEGMDYMERIYHLLPSKKNAEEVSRINELLNDYYNDMRLLADKKEELLYGEFKSGSVDDRVMDIDVQLDTLKNNIEQLETKLEQFQPKYVGDHFSVPGNISHMRGSFIGLPHEWLKEHGAFDDLMPIEDIAVEHGDELIVPQDQGFYVTESQSDPHQLAKKKFYTSEFEEYRKQNELDDASLDKKIQQRINKRADFVKKHPWDQTFKNFDDIYEQSEDLSNYIYDLRNYATYLPTRQDIAENFISRVDRLLEIPEGYKNREEFISSLRSDIINANDGEELHNIVSPIYEKVKANTLKKAKQMGVPIPDSDVDHEVFWSVLSRNSETLMNALKKSPDYIKYLKEKDKFDEAVREAAHIKDRVENYKKETIPDLPMKSNWHEYQIKRDLYDSARRGDKFYFWETGSKQSAANAKTPFFPIEGKLIYDPKTKTITSQRIPTTFVNARELLENPPTVIKKRVDTKQLGDKPFKKRDLVDLIRIDPDRVSFETGDQTRAAKEFNAMSEMLTNYEHPHPDMHQPLLDLVLHSLEDPQQFKHKVKSSISVLHPDNYFDVDRKFKDLFSITPRDRAKLYSAVKNNTPIEIPLRSKLSPEGFKMFYDKIRKSYIENAIKKYGGEVKLYSLPNEQKTKAWGFKWTPELRKQVLKYGFPMYMLPFIMDNEETSEESTDMLKQMLEGLKNRGQS